MSERSPRNGSIRWRLSLLNSLSVISTLGISFLVVMGLIQAIVPFASVRTALDQRAGDGSADVYTQELHRRIVTALAVSVVGAIAGVVLCLVRRETLRKSCRVILSEFRELAGSLLRSAWNDWVVLALVAVLATLLRWPFIHLPMRFDESYTYLHYASQPLYVTLSKYDAPNNHILHSVMVWLATRIGGNSPEVIRLPALICGVLTCVAAAWWTSRRAGRMWGLVAGSLVATSSILVEYSVNARGYTLVHFLLMLLLIISDEWVQRPSRTTIAVATTLAALALWTMPSAVYPLLVSGLGIGGSAWSTHKLSSMRHIAVEVFLAVGLAAGLTLLLYAPVLIVSGWSAIVSSGLAQFDNLSSWSLAKDNAVQEAFVLLLRDMPIPVMVVLLVGWFFSLHTTTWVKTIARREVTEEAGQKHHDQTSRLTCPTAKAIPPEPHVAESRSTRCPGDVHSIHILAWSMVAGLITAFGLLAFQRIFPPPRTWLFILPVFGSVCIVGMAKATRGWNRAILTIIQTGLIVIVCLWPGNRVLTSPMIAESTETGVCPHAKAIIADLAPQLSPGEPIIAVSPASAPLVYYGMRQGISPQHFFLPDGVTAKKGSAIVVVSHSENQKIEQVLQSLTLATVYSQHTSQLIRSYPDAEVYLLSPPVLLKSP